MNTLKWGRFPLPVISDDPAKAGSASAGSRVYLYLATDEGVRVYEMSAFEPLCPINRDRATRFAEVDSVESAKEVAQGWAELA